MSDSGSQPTVANDERRRSKKKKRRAEDLDQPDAEVAADAPRKKKKKRAVQPEDQEHPAAAAEQASADDPGPQDPAYSLLSAIVAAATGNPTPDQMFNPALIPPYPYFSGSGVTMAPPPLLLPNGSSASHDIVLRALQDIDISKIADVLKTLGDAAAAAPSNALVPVPVPVPVHNILPPPVPTLPGQVPVSSDSILGRHAGTSAQRAATSSGVAQNSHAYILANKWISTTKLKELVRTEGLVYRKGKFTATEEAQLDQAIKNYRDTRQLTEAQLNAMIFPTDEQNKDNSFWTEITSAVPLRPIIAVYHHVRRAYHHLEKQGKWLPAEDDRLRAAVDAHGQQWEKVSQMVGRRAGDCRDRYRNHIVGIDVRVRGPWSTDEEEELTRIVTEMTVQKGKDMDHDIFWGKVSEKMGGRRGRQQCRIKWTDSLSKVIKNDGDKSRWGDQDAYILVHKIDSLNVHDDSEIDWKSIPDPHWNLWSAHILQRRWLTMKKSVKGHEEISHQELMDILKAKKVDMSATAPPSKKRKEVIVEPDEPGPSSGKKKGTKRGST